MHALHPPGEAQHLPEVVMDPHNLAPAYSLSTVAGLRASLTILALSLALVTQTEVQVGSNERTVTRTFYAADSGLGIAAADAETADRLRREQWGVEGWVSGFLPGHACICWRASVCEVAMSFELLLGGVLAAAMLVYLIFALLRPEKF